jgi:hypothetical protein
VDAAGAKRDARYELACHAAALADAAEDTASENARDTVGARDARRMARAYRELATLLDPAAFPRPAAPREPAGVIPLFPIPADQRVGAAAEG